MEAQSLGKGLLYINRALTHSVNAKGQAFVVTDPPPRDGVTRDAATGLIQVVLKGRPATGVINDRGDVFGQLIIDNPEPRHADDRLYQRYLHQAFLLPHDAAEPVLIDAPAGYSIEAMSIDDNGVGLGVLVKSRFSKGEVSHTPVAVRLGANGKATWERLVPDSALPPGADTCMGVGRNSAGDLLLHLQMPTGRLFPGGVPDGKGGLTMTCPNIVESLSHGGFFRAGKVEPLEPPKSYTAASPIAILPDDSIVLHASRFSGDSLTRDPYVLKGGMYIPLAAFPGGGSPQIAGADGGLVCGYAAVPDSAMGAPPKNVPEDKREAFYAVRGCAVLWDASTGRMLPLDALLPPGGACTHISGAGGVRARKVLGTGTVNGKMHAVVVTLPEGVAAAFNDSPAKTHAAPAPPPP